MERAEGVRVRIFTAQEELPFAGHPTLGTASVLKLYAPETLHGDTVTLDENVGPVPVRFEGESLFGEMTQRDPEFGEELDRAEVARLLGLAEQDLEPGLLPQIVSTGNPFAIVVLRSLEALGRLKIDQDEATEWLRAHGGRWFYVLAPNPAKTRTVRSTARACSFMAARIRPRARRPAARSAILWGAEWWRRASAFMCGRVWRWAGPAIFSCRRKKESARVRDVRVAGSTVLVAKGQLFLP